MNVIFVLGIKMDNRGYVDSAGLKLYRNFDVESGSVLYRCEMWEIMICLGCFLIFCLKEKNYLKGSRM